jgi:hypothetical protein
MKLRLWSRDSFQNTLDDVIFGGGSLLLDIFQFILDLCLCILSRLC